VVNYEYYTLINVAKRLDMLLTLMDRATWCSCGRFHKSIPQKQGFNLESRELAHVKARLQIMSKVETPIHDNIRELVTWECKEHGVKS
jgi:hypothetical protein